MEIKSQQRCCHSFFYTIVMTIAVVELIYLFVHISWVAFTDYNPFDLISDANRNTSFLEAVEMLVAPQTEFMKQVTVYFDLAEIIICALLILGVFKGVRWLAIPYMIKDGIYAALGLFVVVMSILSILLKQGNVEKSEYAKMTNICLSVLGFAITIYNILVIVVIVKYFQKIKRSADFSRNAKAASSEFYQE
ncbi:uncharacterized protein LOC132199805 [Neocloeon triangulifer]|uniref:uncharacterized protein LOC132199805 n=1 Tax=Neocloeon triangulifer TaxID=2078957 RepID=UPI00286F3751|nr:uncharacterized protein LOC132199805 [Neocloeon triangulifer]